MNSIALLSSALVNVAGLVIGMSPGHWRPHMEMRWTSDCWGYERLPQPALFLAAANLRAGYWAEPGLLESAEAGCPRGTAVDLQAEPNFPLFGDLSPFRDAEPAPRSPVFCVLIGADGRIRRIRSLSGRADPALLAELRRLPFLPALRSGLPASAWHRLVVNLPYPATYNGG